MAEAFDIIFGSIATQYYVLAAVVAIALVFFLRWFAIENQVLMAQAEEKMRPIAAAFDLLEGETFCTLVGWAGKGVNGPLKVHWGTKDESDWRLDYIAIDAQSSGYDTHVRYNEDTQQYKVWSVGVASGDLMASGLYRLGFDEAVLAQLPALSAHEQLELRLSLPHEFWPHKWRDEVGKPEEL